MKSHGEMYQSLLSRYNDYQVKKKRRMIVTRRIVSLAACFTVIFSGYQVWSNIPKMPIQPPIIDELSSENTSEAVSDYSTPSLESTENETQSSILITTSDEANIPKTTNSNTQSELITTQQTTELYQTKPIETKEITIATVPQHTEMRPTTTQSKPVHTTPNITETQKTTIVTTPSTILTTNIIELQTTTVVNTTEMPTETTESPIIYELKFGYEDDKQDIGYHKPSSSIKIAMKCMSFYNSDEKLKIEVIMADASLNPNYYDTSRNYEYVIYACNSLNFKSIDDKRFMVNGEQSEYKRVYSEDEIKLFDINGDSGNYDLYHHELAEIDFSNYEIGDAGCILFSFKVAYMDDPIHPSYMGSNQLMYFYVGEKGTAVSNVSVDEAMKNYQSVVG